MSSAHREPRRGSVRFASLQLPHHLPRPPRAHHTPGKKMLPRNVRRIVLSASAPLSVRTALLSTSSSSRTGLLRTSLRHLPPASRTAGLLNHPHLPSTSSSFHSSARRQNELPKSPFQTFVDVLREELRKNRELQDNVKQLQGDVDKLQDSEAMKKARAAYERARVSFCKGIRVVYVKEAHEIA